jgi:hypothetical protein
MLEEDPTILNDKIKKTEMLIACLLKKNHVPMTIALTALCQFVINVIANGANDQDDINDFLSALSTELNEKFQYLKEINDRL